MADTEEYLCPGCQTTIADTDLMRCPHCFHFFGSERKMTLPYPAENTTSGYLAGLKTVLKKLQRGKSAAADK